MPSIALCIDSQSVSWPAALGLEDENLAAQNWLQIFTSAQDARTSLREQSDVEEVWVLSADDMEAINLAAALKQDCMQRQVSLFAAEESGSLLSRADTAGIDEVLPLKLFARHYSQEKSRIVSRVTVLDSEKLSMQIGSTSVSDLVQAPFQSQEPYQGEGFFQAQIFPQPKELSRLQELSQAGELPQVEGVLQAEELMQVKEPMKVQVRQVSDKVTTYTSSLGEGAFFLPVVSGAGGTGKSTISLLCAITAQRMGYKTLLLDFDLQFGNLRELLGCPKALSIEDVLEVPTRVTRLHSEQAFPALLACPRRLETCDAVIAEAAYLLESLLPRFDVIVANTGAFWMDIHALLLERASKALFLVDQRASSLHACKHALELCDRCGIATNPFVFAVNRCSKGSLFSALDVSCALQASAAVELRDGGRDVEEMLSAGTPLDLFAENNALCDSVEQVLCGILPPLSAGQMERFSVPENSRRLFGRRKSRKGHKKRGAA